MGSDIKLRLCKYDVLLMAIVKTWFFGWAPKYPLDSVKGSIRMIKLTAEQILYPL